MRPIDADLLMEKFKDGDSDTPEEKIFNQVARYFIRHAPTLTQPNEPLTPCNVCRFYPPSSCDGKPCTMCPADRRTPEGDWNGQLVNKETSHSSVRFSLHGYKQGYKKEV